MSTKRSIPAVQTGAAAIAVLFGLATLFAGGRVLLGADPGYLVFRPLLLYNTTMGLAYIAAGLAIWRSPVHGRNAAGTVALMNSLVLVGIGLAYQGGAGVAPDSLRAMTLRTVVWIGLFLFARRLVRRTSETLNRRNTS